jgi:hypothetical protein
MTISVSTLIALAKQAATTASEAQTLFKNVWVSRLSAEEKELLEAAAGEGQFMLLETEQLPDALILVGPLQYPSEAEATDPASFARSLEAFRSLIERKYVQHDAGSVFKLTRAGFTHARKLITG